MSNAIILLYDGDCGLCSRMVQFVLKRDRRAIFHFAPLASPAGQYLLGMFGINQEKQDTFVMIEHNRAHIRSTAALKVCRYLNIPWKLLYPFILIPAPLRDLLYRLAAANRHRLFPAAVKCQLPDPSVQTRLIEQKEDLSNLPNIL